MFGRRSQRRAMEAVLEAVVNHPRVRNEMRMAECYPIWATGGTVVAACPAFDDFLIWFEPTAEPALKVVATADTIKDFRQQVVPAINAHMRACRDADYQLYGAIMDWQMDVMDQIAAGNDVSGPLTPPKDEPQEQRDNSYNEVVTALRAFTERHNAVPDE